MVKIFSDVVKIYCKTHTVYCHPIVKFSTLVGGWSYQVHGNGPYLNSYYK